MRVAVILSLVALAACATPVKQFSDKPPSLKVGAAALAGGAPEAALSVARRQLAENPNDLASLLLEGQALTELGDLSHAEASFRHASRVSSSVAATFGLGRVLLLKGDAPAAEAAFKQVLAKTPDEPRALTDLGIACDLQDHHNEAQKAYLSALKLAPELDAARVNLGLSMALAGNTAGAIEILQPLAANPNAPRRVRHDLATALALAGDHNGAERLLRPDLSADQMPMAMAGYQELHVH